METIGTELKKVEMAISKLDTLKKLVTVTSIKAEINDFNHYLEVQGIVKADQTIELHAEMGGTVTAILVKEGQNVSKGQILATLDSDVIDNSVLQLETQLALATTTYERQTRLWEQNIGSEIQYLQAKAQKESLENNMKSLKAQARKMKITAPFSGIIDQIFAKTGELTSPQMPFLRLVNLNKVYVESEVTETYLKAIKKGTEVLLNFSSIGVSIESSISQVGNFINPNNRSFKTRIDLENPNNELKANLLADIKINDFKATGIVIPSRLVQKDSNDQTFVYTIEPNGSNHKVIKTYLTEAMNYNNLSFISEGLLPTSILVDKGARLINNNEDVKLVHY
jgi:RND family efflux transporter MFP subunit